MGSLWLQFAPSEPMDFPLLRRLPIAHIRRLRARRHVDALAGRQRRPVLRLQGVRRPRFFSAFRSFRSLLSGR